MDDARCTICKRPLDKPSDLLSADCGGDCYGCIIDAEDGSPAPDLPNEELLAWLAAREVRACALWEEASRRAEAGQPPSSPPPIE